MLFEILNKTEEAISIPSVEGVVVLPPSERTIVFSSDDDSTFDSGLYIICYGYKEVQTLIEAGSISVYINEEEQTSKSFIVTRNLLYGELFKSMKVGYSNSSPMYFDYKENELKIYNTVRERWFSVPLAEIIEE